MSARRKLLVLAAAASLASRGASLAADAPEPGSTIVVVTDDNYPPYVFRGQDGSLKGVLPDQWAEWSRVTGVKVDLRGSDWAKALATMAKGEADVIDTMFRTSERERAYDFARPWATLEVPVFMHSSVSGIASVSDLRGFKVAVKEGDAAIAWLVERGIVDLVEYPSYEAIVAAAARLDVRVFCVDRPPAEYFLYRFGIARDFRIGITLYSGEFHRAVRKGDRALLDLVQAGFDGISRATYDEIDRRWFGSPIGLFGDPRVPLVAGGVALLALGIALFLAYDSRRLRAKVSAATRELREKMLVAENSEARARAALAEKEVLLREVHHRVKNNMQIVSSLVSLQEGTVGDELDRERFHDLQRRIRSMARVHELLYETSDFASIDFAEYLRRMVEEVSSGFGADRVAMDLASSRVPLEKAMPLALLANELLTNAFKYGARPGEAPEVRVRLSRDGARATLAVRDSGSGPSQGVELLSSRTMGYVLIRSLAAQLGGELSFSTEDGFEVRVSF